MPSPRNPSRKSVSLITPTIWAGTEIWSDKDMLSRPYDACPLKFKLGLSPRSAMPWYAQVEDVLDWKIPPLFLIQTWLPSHPPGPTTHVSWLAVLTSTSTHCGGVPTRIETGLQTPSSPTQDVRTGTATAVGVACPARQNCKSQHERSESVTRTFPICELFILISQIENRMMATSRNARKEGCCPEAPVMAC